VWAIFCQKKDEEEPALIYFNEFQFVGNQPFMNGCFFLDDSDANSCELFKNRAICR
jgi:hypothetical protein